MRPFALLTLIFATLLCLSANADPREDELAYLRTVMPDSLLEYAHLEVGSLKGVSVLGEGQAKHLGLHVFPGQEGKPALALTYGPSNGKLKPRAVGPVVFEQGKWHAVSVVIHWSLESDGKVAVFLDDLAKP